MTVAQIQYISDPDNGPYVVLMPRIPHSFDRFRASVLFRGKRVEAFAPGMVGAIEALCALLPRDPGDYEVASWR